MKPKMLITFSWLVLISAIFSGNAIANRNIEVSGQLESVSDLKHGSGKLGSYKALIIGINDYEDENIPDLKTAIKDAEGLADILRDKYGFKVETLLNRQANKKMIYQALRKLAAEAKEDDSVLIYYAGHGDIDQVYKDGWWIPSDAKGGDPFTYLDNTQVQKAMSSTKARHVLLISDSCYSGTLFGKSRALPAVITEKFYLNKYNEQSRWGMTSGNKEPVSDRGTGGHSIFAYQLLKELRQNEKPYLTPREIYTRIAPIIGNNSEQTPLCAPIRNTGDQGGEFVFVSTDNVGNGDDEAEKLEEELKRLQAQRKKDESQAGKFAAKLKEGELRRKIAEEKQKAQKARRKKEAAEKKLQKLAAVWKSEDGQVEVYTPDPDGYRETGRDEDYIAYDNGVVYDSNTGLEWVVGPDKDTTWYEAKAWVESLSVAGGGWRLPTRDELWGLNQKETPLLKTADWWVWSGEIKGSSSAWHFSFFIGDDLWGERDNSKDCRGFAVRYRSKSAGVNIEVSTPDPETGDTKPNSVGMKFVYIEPGTFMMGIPENEYGRNSDRKQHQVTLTKGFYMQTTEVTQGQWKAVMGSNPSHFKNCGDDCPVETVSWNDAQAFIKKLNQREGGDKYRLPTEAEWEYAARAGSRSMFSFGDNVSRLGEYAWYSANSDSKTHQVGQKKPNARGLYDMMGNVTEWCQDWYGDYPSGSVTDSEGPSNGEYRVFRGGSWDYEPWDARCDYRNSNYPVHGDNSWGFRCVRTK